MFEEQEEYDRYHRFATEECLLQAGGALCPQPGCGAGIMPDNPGERRIRFVRFASGFKEFHENCLTKVLFSSS